MTYFILPTNTGTCYNPTKRNEKLGRGLQKMKSNGPRRQKLERKNFLAMGEACIAVFRYTPGFKGRTFGSSGFSTSGDFNVCVRSTLLRRLHFEISSGIELLHVLTSSPFSFFLYFFSSFFLCTLVFFLLFFGCCSFFLFLCHPSSFVLSGCFFVCF